MGPSTIPEAEHEYFTTNSPRNEVSIVSKELSWRQMISGLRVMANQMESQNVSDITNSKFEAMQRKFASLKRVFSENSAFQVF